MSIVNSIATASIGISSANVASQVSLSVLKKSMEQSSANIMKILEGAENLAPVPKGNIDITI